MGTMGTRGREIVGVNTEKVLAQLNKAFADEWLACYQYWLGAKVAQGADERSGDCRSAAACRR